MPLYYLCCSTFYNNDNDAIVVLPEIQPFLSLVFTICQSHRAPQIIPESQVVFIKRQLSTTEALAANPFQLK